MGLIFDIGSNTGSFAKAWRNSGEYNKVICVEANPELIPVLDGLFFEDKNVVVINKLVTDTVGKLTDFHICKNHVLSTASIDWMCTSRFANRFKDARKIQVESITLDDLVKLYGEPNLIKIDVEGHEFEVLQGLTTKQQTICFEWVEERTARIIECCKYLMRLGYTQFAYTLREDYLHIPEKYYPFHELDFFHNINITGFTKWGNFFAR